MTLANFKRIKSGEYMLDISLFRSGDTITGVGQIWHGISIIHGFNGGRYGIPEKWQSEKQAFADLRVYALWVIDAMGLPNEFASIIQYGDIKEKPPEHSIDNKSSVMHTELEKSNGILPDKILAGQQLSLF